LTGKLSTRSTFQPDDHRAFNRHGEAFDRGETFSGVDYETGLWAVAELRQFIPTGWTMAQFALRWILAHPAVTCAIPGAKNPLQAEENARAASLPALSDETMERIRAIYDSRIRELVHYYW
jgi:aryl-alcohol dehydrogenase-like predicted oxidoreductase